MICHGVADERFVFGDDRRPAVPEDLDEPSRALHVSEEKGDGSGGKFVHAEITKDG